MSDIKISPVNIDLTPLVESAPKGVNKLFDLLFSKHLNRQQRTDKLSSAQIEKDIKLIENGIAEFRDGKFILNSEMVNNPTTVVGNIINNQTTIEQENVQQSLNKALEYLSRIEDHEVSDDIIEQTFFNKWFNFSKEVSDDELQSLWGRLLAEELCSPNTINYLVLNTFSLMSKRQLDSFLKIVPYTAYSHLVFYDNNRLKNEAFEGTSSFELQELQDLKLIKEFNSTFQTSFPLSFGMLDNKDTPYISKSYKGNYVLFLKSKDNKEVSITAYQLTSIGQKALEIAEKDADIASQCQFLAKQLLTFRDLEHITDIEIQRLDSNGKYEFIDNIKRS
jgi:hypothetical protein